MSSIFQDIDTPALMIDMDKVRFNIDKAQKYADNHGLKLRPHIKTHKLPEIAELQLKAGASGINCQKISEAEAMVDALTNNGSDPELDVLITFNIIGERKLQRLGNLAKRVHLNVVADSEYTVNGYSGAATEAGVVLNVFVECDTGGLRAGVTTPEQALSLAKKIVASPCLRLAGLMTYPAHHQVSELSAWEKDAKVLFEKGGVEIPTITVGGTPDMWSAHKIEGITETRPGTYVYMDRAQVHAGAGSLEECAQTVLSTVVSRPTALRVVCDAGSKALTSDLLGLDGYGIILGYPNARLDRLSEEHGVIEASRPEDLPPIGTQIQIVPNHACVVTNMFNTAYLTEKGKVIKVANIVARGCVV